MKKRLIAFMAVMAVAASILAGCGQKVMCDFCGEEKKCETRTVLGEDIHICEDCLDELENLVG